MGFPTGFSFSSMCEISLVLFCLFSYLQLTTSLNSTSAPISNITTSNPPSTTLLPKKGNFLSNTSNNYTGPTNASLMTTPATTTLISSTIPSQNGSSSASTLVTTSTSTPTTQPTTKPPLVSTNQYSPSYCPCDLQVIQEGCLDLYILKYFTICLTNVTRCLLAYNFQNAYSENYNLCNFISKIFNILY